MPTSSAVFVDLPEKPSDEQIAEALLRVGQARGKDGMPPRVVLIGGDLPDWARKVLKSWGESVVAVRAPRLLPGGGIALPAELRGHCEMIPGEPQSNFPCQPVLNLFPDAPVTKWDLKWNFMEPGAPAPCRLVELRLREAADRYMRPEARCAETLQSVRVSWQDGMPDDDRETECFLSERWEEFQALLESAREHGVTISVSGPSGVRRLGRRFR